MLMSLDVFSEISIAICYSRVAFGRNYSKATDVFWANSGTSEIQRQKSGIFSHPKSQTYSAKVKSEFVT